MKTVKKKSCGNRKEKVNRKAGNGKKQKWREEIEERKK